MVALPGPALWLKLDATFFGALASKLHFANCGSGARNSRPELWASKDGGNAPHVIPYSARRNQIGCPH
jgi:hypothetical protein